MSQEIKIGDAVWNHSGGFGFIVDHIEREGGRDVYYGWIAGQKIYVVLEACQKINPMAQPELLEALDYLLEQTIDQDLKYGIVLTEGEEDARQRARAVIAKVAA